MHAPAEALITCGSCGAPLEGSFCSQCGEHAVHEGDLALSHLTHEFLHEFTHIDGKIWRTLKALLFQPGKLTVEYWAGRRGQWIRPLRLYLVISALILVLASRAAGPLGMRIWVDQKHNYTVGTRPELKPGSAPVDAEFTHHVQSIYLWTRYLSLGFFAAAGLLAYRKRQPYFGAHLIFAMHFYSFEYVVSGLREKIWADMNPTIPLGLGIVYLYLALRRVYGEGWLRTAAKCVWMFFVVAVAEMLTMGPSLIVAIKIWRPE